MHDLQVGLTVKINWMRRLYTNLVYVYRIGDKMYYITTMQHRKPRQLSWEDVVMDKFTMNEFVLDKSTATGTITKKFEKIPEDVLLKVRPESMIFWLKKFNVENANLFETDRKNLYNSFKIPKATGGFRQIDAPCEELQEQLRRLAKFLSDDCGLLYHTSAFAYVKGRSIKDCVAKHQKSESNWFLKTSVAKNTTILMSSRFLVTVGILRNIFMN